ncbi:hypothetical protein HPB52_024655 [Rhipicephalus sanguineus]|uniref:Uncharacterized protein n=1 Tax=Rhipicephalus sanguineus TaxID=34632 RepID=A0A9D4YRU2_RHISA|nr:hypothetical protein HPB52_024655 [Rhipicephalus sanguineus]
MVEGKTALALERKETMRFFFSLEYQPRRSRFSGPSYSLAFERNPVRLKSRDKLVECGAALMNVADPYREPPYKPSGSQRFRVSGQPPNEVISSGSLQYGSHVFDRHDQRFCANCSKRHGKRVVEPCVKRFRRPATPHPTLSSAPHHLPSDSRTPISEAIFIAAAAPSEQSTCRTERCVDVLRVSADSETLPPRASVLVDVTCCGVGDGEAVAEANLEHLLKQGICVARSVIQLCGGRSQWRIPNFSNEHLHLFCGTSIAFANKVASLTNCFTSEAVDTADKPLGNIDINPALSSDK